MFYIANTFFELELEGRIHASLKDAFTKNPIFEQLQYLPLLFISKDDTLIVTKHPPNEYLDRLQKERADGLPRIQTFDETFEEGLLSSWGASELISKWAKSKGLIYEMPSLSCSRTVNSKLWNFESGHVMKESKIVFSLKDLEEGMQNASCNWVLKTDQGFAGRGHFVFNSQTIAQALTFANKEWNQKRGLILEPWVERLCDFSSQWKISKEGDYSLLGLTKCINSSSGSYLGTESGDNTQIFGAHLPFVHEHVTYCKKHLRAILRTGFFGNLGFDSMVYKDPNSQESVLYPILEVNARMTMSSALLLFHQNYSKNEVTRIYYRPDDSNITSLLPNGYNRKLIIT